MTDWERIKVTGGLATAALVALWLSLPATVLALLGLMSADILLGALLAARGGRLAAAIAGAGLDRKAATLLLVAAVALMQRPFGDQVPAAAVVAGWYCWQEFTSLARNATALGVPLPEWLRAALAKPPGGGGQPEAR